MRRGSFRSQAAPEPRPRIPTARFRVACQTRVERTDVELRVLCHRLGRVRELLEKS
jgi:hypothetical protein